MFCAPCRRRGLKSALSQTCPTPASVPYVLPKAHGARRQRPARVLTAKPGPRDKPGLCSTAGTIKTGLSATAGTFKTDRCFIVGTKTGLCSTTGTFKPDLRSIVGSQLGNDG
jgi:hypothetical protein